MSTSHDRRHIRAATCLRTSTPRGYPRSPPDRRGGTIRAMVWPIVRRLGATVAVTVAALAVVLSDRSTLSTLGLVSARRERRASPCWPERCCWSSSRSTPSPGWRALTAVAVAGLAVGRSTRQVRGGGHRRCRRRRSSRSSSSSPWRRAVAHRRAVTVAIVAIGGCRRRAGAGLRPLRGHRLPRSVPPQPGRTGDEPRIWPHLLGVLIAGASVGHRGRHRRRGDPGLANEPPTNSFDRPAELAIAAAASLLGDRRRCSSRRPARSRCLATPPRPFSPSCSWPSSSHPAALILIALDPLRARRDVGRVARLLASDAGTTDPQAILRAGFGDPGLLVGYWAEGIGYLDEHGECAPRARRRRRASS